MKNQAVNQPQVLPPSSQDQWYCAPEVGSDDASSAMLSTTNIVPAVTIGQPMVIEEVERVVTRKRASKGAVRRKSRGARA